MKSFLCIFVHYYLTFLLTVFTFQFDWLPFPSSSYRWENEICPKTVLSIVIFNNHLFQPSFKRGKSSQLSLGRSSCCTGNLSGEPMVLNFSHLSLLTPMGCSNWMLSFWLCLFQKSISVLLGPQFVFSSVIFLFLPEVSVLCLLVEEMLLLCWEHKAC